GSKISFDHTTSCTGTPTIITRRVSDGATTDVIATAEGAIEPTVHPAVPAPRPVEGLRAVAGAAKVTVRWTKPIAAASMTPLRIIVRRSRPGGAAPASPTQGVAVYNGTGTSATANGLTNGKTYTFAVFVVDKLGHAAPVESRKATPHT